MGNAYGQGCSSAAGASYQGTIVPTTSYQSLTANAGYYWKFHAATCNKYIFSFCPTEGGTVGWDSELTVDDSTGMANTGGYNNDYCLIRSYLEWTPTTSGNYRIFVTKNSCSNTTGSAATLVYKVVPQNTITSEYALVGNASAPSGCATLTADAANQIGCAWDVNSTLNFTSAFSYDFTVNLGSNDGGADGLCFVMQNDPRGLCACGASGGSMGASGITKSVIIELDTYLNYEDRDDGIPGVLCSGGPNPDHIDLWLNGNVNPTGTCGVSPGARIIPAAVPLKNGAADYNIENGLDHLLRISWVPSGATGTLTASVMDIAASVVYATFSYAFNPATVFGTQTPYFGFTASTGALTNLQSACLSSLLLPVTLSSFTADCIQGKEVKLQWQTKSELNNSSFSVERSADGEHFYEITKLAGAGTSAIPNKYSWSDEHPIKGLAYYRLAEISNTGNLQYTPVISTTCEAKDQSLLKAYSDGNGNLMVIFDGGADNVKGLLQLVDMNGRVLINQPIAQTASGSPMQIQLHTGNLPAGIYTIIFKNEQQFICTRAAL